MTETGFRTFYQLYSAAVELLHAGLFAGFLRPFLALPGRRGRGPAAVFFLYLLCQLLCRQAALPLGSFGLMLAASLAAVSKWAGLERSAALLLTLLYFNARISGGLMAESVYFLLEQALPPLAEPPERVFLRAAALVTLFLAFHTVLFAAMLWGLQRRLRAQRSPLHRRELCYLALIPAAGILFGQMISRLMVEFQDGVLTQLYQRHPPFLAAVPALALLFYAGTYLTIAFQQGAAALREEQAARSAEYQQVQAIRTRIREVERFYAQIRELKHELRGHLTNLKGLARSGAYEELSAYIARMDGTIQDFAPDIQTGNPVTDVIIGSVRRRCLELNIGFQAEFHYPEAEAFDAFDLGVILQNLLQNALEACEKLREGPRRITLTGRRSGRFFLLEVQNTYTGEVIFSRDGLPATTKRDAASMHGIGLSTVRREAEKYLGGLDLTAADQLFTATVLLQERSDL